MDSGGDIELGMESTLNRMNNVLQAEAHSQLPPGFRFHPTDEELVCYYLTEKIRDSTFSCSAIAEANLNKCEPWDLPAKAKIGEIEWYFFNLKDRKYPKGLRTNRATEAGYWKTTGKDRQLFSSQSSALFGMKKTLVFYKGRAPNGEKTNWVMHEYRLQSKFSYHPLLKQCKDEWVVCRIFEKSAETNRRSIGRMSRNIFLDLPGSPSLPSLWESLCNTNSANDQKNRSSESGLGTSEKAHNVSCSILMEPNSNSKGQHLQQFECGSSLNYSDSSDQLSEMTRFMNQSSYMHDLMLNDPRIHMNAGSFFPVTNMRRDQISAILDQQLPGLLPARLCNTQMPLSSNSSNLGFSTDAYLPALPCSNEVSKAPVGQSAGNLLKSFSSSCVIHYETLGKANNCVNRFQWSNDGLSQKIMAQPIQKADGATCSTEDMNDEMTSVDYNLLARSLDQLDSSATPPFHF